MGQQVGVEANFPGGYQPSGYQPSPGQQAAASSGGRLYAEDGLWKGSDIRPGVDDRPAYGGHASQYAGHHAQPARAAHFPANDNLASFATDVDRACAGGGPGSGGGGFRSNSFQTDVDAAFENRIGQSQTMFGGGTSSWQGNGGSAPLSKVPYPEAASHGSGYDCGGSRPGAGAGRRGGGEYDCGSAFGSMSTPLGSYAGTGVWSGGRESWDVGSVLEVYSSSSGRWYVARVMKVQQQSAQDVMTVQFVTDDGPKMKSQYRSDSALAVFGTNVVSELPPGFETKPSQSKPGTVVYFDATTGTKYARPELAWQVHLERLLIRPSAAGQQTVAFVPPVNTGSVAGSAVGSRGPGIGHTGMGFGEADSDIGANDSASVCGGGQGHPVMSLADLAAERARRSGQFGAPPPRGFNGGYSPTEPSEAGWSEADDPRGNGKVALPSFGDARQSRQAAYLNAIGTAGTIYEGAGGEDEHAYATESYAQPAAAVPAAQQRPPARYVNPAVQAWQEDPFSEWRR
eukprot:TRINITY_DN26764_c0_g1_i1.p1 TRINITY_DN26764_c0_g1~~TRINITY_DN26764_c0_g1_i1.p1  ORF type:complete len:514 (+),score=80.98 TRINITY_DN26764_c0_g1_i1:104-1645(+)